MAEILPQLDDRRVREMADRNHRPTEAWSVSGSLLSLHCGECSHPWPCPTRKAVDEIKAAQKTV